MVLVAGATGELGSAVCRMLMEQGTPVRALVRTVSSPERVNDLRALGVELALGDLRDAESLRRACDGVDAVISTASATGRHAAGESVETVDGAGQAALVDAARHAGVRKYVFVSFSGAIDVDSPLHTSKRAVEERVRNADMDYTVLRPTAFMEVWLSPMLGFDPAGGTVTVYGTGEEPVSYISRADVARFCVAALTHPAARNVTLELGGPEAVSPNEAIRIAEVLRGETLAVQRIPVETLRARWAGATDPLQKSLAAIALALAAGDAVDMTATLEQFPLELRSVNEHIAELVQRVAPQAPTAG